MSTINDISKAESISYSDWYKENQSKDTESKKSGKNDNVDNSREKYKDSGFDDSYIDRSSKNAGALLAAGLGVSMDTGATPLVNLSDYAMIKNGSYKKLVKAYYAKEKADNASAGADSKPRLSLIAGDAGAMAKSAQVLMQKSLWEKKKVVEKDKDTGEETEKEEYDWKSITKAVKSFVDNYNNTVDRAAGSNTKEVLRYGAWMTKTTSVNEGLLKKVGITIGKGNKLELNEEELQKADIATLKTLFTGHNSYASQMMSKGNSIAGAAASAGARYTNTGGYSGALSSLASSKIDTKE